MTSRWIRHRRVSAPHGPDLLVEDGGSADAPAVVLLHGGGQTRHSWSAAMAVLLAEGYRVLNFDARGHGDSGWSPEGAYELDDRVDDLEAVIDGLPGPVALVGASLGGATALHAVARGLGVTAVVLVDIVPAPEPAGIDRIVSFMRGSPTGFATLEDAVDAVAAYNPGRPRPVDPSGLMRNLRLRDDGRLHWHWDPRITSGEPARHHAVVSRSAGLVADRCDLPVLLVRGMRSDVVSDAGVEAFRTMMPRLQVANVADAGHMVAGDRNDAFNAAVVGFLRAALPIGAVGA